MKLNKTFLEDVFILEPDYFTDERGGFARLYCQQELSKFYPGLEIKQINHSINRLAGTIRGMHFQYPPNDEIKFVKCTKGAVLDVVVDIRKGSKTFLKYLAVELTSNNNKMLCIPKGVAHGFQTLQDDTELLYLHSAFYTPNNEGGLNFGDSKLNIDWVLPVQNISERDLNFKMLEDSFKGI